MQHNITDLLELAMEVSRETSCKVGFTFAPTAGEMTFHFFETGETHSIDVNSKTASWDVESITHRLLDLVIGEVAI